jgi:hypothetical protein
MTRAIGILLLCFGLECVGFDLLESIRAFTGGEHDFRTVVSILGFAWAIVIAANVHRKAAVAAGLGTVAAIGMLALV